MTIEEKLDLISLRDIDLYQRIEEIDINNDSLREIKIKLIKEIAKE